MRKIGFWVAIVMSLMVAGCTTVLPTLSPAPAEIIIQHTPAVHFAEAVIQNCSLKNSPLPVLVNEYSIDKMNAQSADISLMLANPIDPALSSYQIGQEKLVIIVNPQNQLDHISLVDLRGILQGFIPSWDKIKTETSPKFIAKIQLYSYVEKDELQHLIVARLNNGKNFASTSQVFQNPEEVVNAVIKDPGGMGIIPQGYLNDSVTTISLTETSSVNLSIAIIAQTRNKPAGNVLTMLGCLQDQMAK